MNFFNRTIQPDEAGDEALLNSYRQTGDLAVLGKLYEKYMSLVYGVCLKYLKDEELSKDAVMGIFEELVEKAKRHEVKQFRGWLYVLARNYCLMQLRRDKKIEVVALDDVMEFGEELHPDTKYSEEYLKVLERCMRKLPANQRQSVDLFYLQEKCYKEIADENREHVKRGKKLYTERETQPENLHREEQ